MLVSISTTTSPASDLLTLLNLDPNSIRSEDLGFGMAKVFCPELRHDRCEVSIVLDWAPHEWFQRRVRTRLGPKFPEAEVNDRSFAGGVIFARALTLLFPESVQDICPNRPELAGHALTLQVEFSTVYPEFRGFSWDHLFSPLGFEIETHPILSKVKSSYHTVRLRKLSTVAEVLNSLIYLAPTLDPGPWHDLFLPETDLQVNQWLNQLTHSHPCHEWILHRWREICRETKTTATDRLNALRSIFRPLTPTLESDNGPQQQDPRDVAAQQGVEECDQRDNVHPGDVSVWLKSLPALPKVEKESTTHKSISAPALVVVSGSGASWRARFIHQLFLDLECVSVEAVQQWIPKDPNSDHPGQDPEVEEIFHSLVGLRLKRNQMTVVDIEGRSRNFRNELIRLAKRYHLTPAWFFLDSGKSAKEGSFEKKARQEGFRDVWIVDPSRLEELELKRLPARTILTHWTGPFDVIGDVHGCFEELLSLLKRLGYRWQGDPWKPEAEAGLRLLSDPRRFPVFVGDLVDRGPYPVETIKLVMHLCRTGQAGAAPGNHDEKLARALDGVRFKKVDEDFTRTLDSVRANGKEFGESIRDWVRSLPSHLVLDGGRLVVAHAGSKESHHGRDSRNIREFSLYGATTGELDEHGLPERLNWAADYAGSAWVVYGHTPGAEPKWENRTVNIDTGCAYGGYLTALRFPEMETVSEPAKKEYAVSKRPLPLNHQLKSQPSQENFEGNAGIKNEWFDIPFVTLRKSQKWETFRTLKEVDTGRRGIISLREDKVRTAIDWLKSNGALAEDDFLLTPSLVATDANPHDQPLECPASAFRYLKHNKSRKAVCVPWIPIPSIVFKCSKGQGGSGSGFEFGPRFQTALEASGFWERVKAESAIFECEIIQSELVDSLWEGIDGQGRIKQLGDAALSGAGMILEQFHRAAENGLHLDSLVSEYQKRRKRYEGFVHWIQRVQANFIEEKSIQLKQLRLLATDKVVVAEQSFDQQEALLGYETLQAADRELFVDRGVRMVDLHNQEDVEEAVEAWKQAADQGGFGWRVSPVEGAPPGRRGWIQPALKCRGPEALRLVYGLDYTREDQMEIVLKRNLTACRTQAAREWALALEWLRRWVGREPIWRRHECLVGMMAVRAEPTDPRL